MATMGQMLKTIRIARAMTQEELAQKSGIHASTISRIERGRYNPTEKEKRQFEDALGIRFKDIRASYEALANDDDHNN